LGNNSIGQLDRRAIQQNHVDPICVEGTSQFVGETSPNTTPIDGPVDQYGQVVIAHWAEIAFNLRAKQIDQAHTFKAGQYG
jgi:hypothetical protein